MACCPHLWVARVARAAAARRLAGGGVVPLARVRRGHVACTADGCGQHREPERDPSDRGIRQQPHQAHAARQVVGDGAHRGHGRLELPHAGRVVRRVARLAVAARTAAHDRADGDWHDQRQAEAPPTRASAGRDGGVGVGAAGVRRPLLRGHFNAVGGQQPCQLPGWLCGGGPAVVGGGGGPDCEHSLALELIRRKAVPGLQRHIALVTSRRHRLLLPLSAQRCHAPAALNGDSARGHPAFRPGAAWGEGGDVLLLIPRAGPIVVRCWPSSLRGAAHESVVGRVAVAVGSATCYILISAAAAAGIEIDDHPGFQFFRFFGPRTTDD
jgi:hypothetical protein